MRLEERMENMKDPACNDIPASSANNPAWAERNRFVLDVSQWESFAKALHRPVQSKPALERLLNEPGVLDS